MSVNKVMLIGRLGHDPELRNTGGGTAVVNLRLATSDRRKDGDDWVDHTEWHNVTVWGRVAENVVKYCSKGKELFVEGRLQTRKYTDKSGADRYSTEVVADNVKFLGSRGDSPATGGGQRQLSGGDKRADGEIPF